MKRFVLLLLVMTSLAFAIDLEPGAWVISTNAFGAGPNDMSIDLVSDDGLKLKLESSAKGRAYFKLATVYDTPTNQSYDIEFEARVIAPGADLDYSFNFGAGEKTDNDGPNLFAFAYSFENATVENLPIRLDTSSFYDQKKSLCHMHMECNWLGDPESYYGFFCSNELTKSGWLYDAQKYGKNVKVNNWDAEPFQDTEWKTIRLNMDAGECNKKNTTLMIMGVDALNDVPYTWEIRNIKLIADDVISLPLTFVYIKTGDDYTRVAKPAFCGDAEKDAGEECDGDVGVDPGWKCTSNCKLKEICGDNKVVGTELCDGIIHTPGFKCAANCSAETPICGDGIIVDSEVCDGNSTPEGFKCSSDCKSMSSVCGDGIVVANEECDGTVGTDEAQGCTPKCTLYRLLTDDEQKGIDSLIKLIEASEVGVPSISKITIPPGNYTSKDFSDQYLLKNQTLDGNVSFCVAGVTECEARYVFIEDAMATKTQISPAETLSGIAKVYKIATNNTTSYYIGFKGSAGWLPYIEMDATMGIIIGILLFFLLIAGLFLLLLAGGYIYVTNKDGVQFRKIFK